MSLSAHVTMAAEPARFELRDQDRVVMLGGTFIEREGQFGYFETAMMTAFPDLKITFRNLGWSGDTVWAESRGIFDPAATGYQRMIDLVKELNPTVIILAYGQNESFAGDPAAGRRGSRLSWVQNSEPARAFEEGEAGLSKFVAQYEKLCDDVGVTHARLVFMTPHRFERPLPPLPDASRQNLLLEMYAKAVRELAQRRNAPVVDLFALPQSSDNLTENGIHFGAHGYAVLASEVQRQQNWGGPKVTSERSEEIRRKIVQKNMMFFHRWRPQNITYLTGFRKYEQGNNAVEIAQFDPIVEAIETEIAEMNHN